MSQNTTRYREVLLEFIAIYQSEPCLWKVKSKGYHNRDKRNAALDKLLTKYKEIDEKANRDVVLKKINSLRTAYNKEKKKVEETKRSGAGTDAVYEPKLWYYKELSFINDQNLARDSISTIDDEEENADEEQLREQQYTDFENNSQPNEQSSQPIEQSSQPNEQSSEQNEKSTAGNSARRPTPKRKNDDSLVNSVLQSVDDHFKRPRDDRKEDRHDIYCKSVATKLRDLPSQQRVLAEKLINDVLFEAEWGNLTLDFKVIPSPNIQRQQQTNSPSYQITSSSHSSYQASPSPNIQHQQQTNSPSYQITSPSHSSYQASPSPNIQHQQQTNSPSYQITSPSHSSYQASPSPNIQHQQQTNSPSYQITSPSHSSYQASPSPNIQHQQQTNSPSYQITCPSHSSYQASPSPNIQHQQQTNSPSYQITSPSHSSYQASPSPNIQHQQQTNSPSYQITSPSHSSYQASPSPNIQHQQQTNSPSYQITSPSHSSSQNVQNDLHFSQRHEAPGPENLLSIPEDSAASFLVNFLPQ